MVKFAFLLTLAPYTTQDADTVINMAKAVLEEGHEISGIYLYVDGVYNAFNKIDPKSEEERNIAKMFEELAAQGVPIKVCPVCGNYRGINEESMLITGAEFDGLGGMAEIFEDADKVICFT